MSLSLKLGSLAVRTLAKPIGNWIKTQAREHEAFRRRCVAIAQALHRLDMRMKLGLLQDAAAIDRQIEREAAEASSKRRAASTSGAVPYVPTEAEAKAQQEAAKKEKQQIGEKVRSDEKKKEARRIRPLSEAKAIDSGATFISETFLFLVAAGLIGFETWRTRRKQEKSRTAVDERLDAFEEALKKGKEENVHLVEELEQMRAQLRVAKAAAEKQRGREKANGDTIDNKVEALHEEKAAEKTKDAKNKKIKPATEPKTKPHRTKEKHEGENHEKEKKGIHTTSNVS